MQEQIDDDVVLLCGDFGTEGSPRRIQADRIREAFDLVLIISFIIVLKFDLSIPSSFNSKNAKMHIDIYINTKD